MEIPKHYELVEDGDKHFEVHDKRDGKRFKISKKDLHPAHQIKIMKMQKFSEGGKVEEVPDYIKKTLENSKTEPEMGSWGRLDDQKSNLPDFDAERAANTKAFEENQARMNPSMAMNTVQPPTAPIAPTPAPMQAPAAPQTAPIVQDQAAAQQAAMQKLNQPTPQPQASSIPGYPTPESLDGMQKSYESAIMGGARGQMALNQETGRMRDQHAAFVQLAADDMKATLAQKQAQYDQLAHDIASQKIDANRFWNTKDGSSKAMASIGIMLSGLSGSSHNMAMDILQKNIDRDIQSQKDDLGRKQTLLSDNLRQQGSIIAAEAATRAQYETAFQGKLAAMAAKMGNPMIQAQAQQMIMESRLRMMPMMQQVAQNEMMMKMLGNNGASPEQKLEVMRVLAPERAKEMESRYVPGAGFATIPLTEKDRSELAGKIELANQTRDLMAWAKKHEGSLDPAIIAEGDSRARQLMDNYRTAHQQGVYKESEKDFIGGILTENPTAFFGNLRVQPKLKAVYDTTVKSLNNLSNKVGLKLPANNGLMEPETKVVNGVTYKRGPRGEAIPVN
jgi:hypothetical protein